MSDRNDSSAFSPTLSHKAAVPLFIVVLVGFVAETQLTQYTQTSLGFRQPYFIFYIVHSSFAIIFPLHFLYLVLIRRNSPRALISGLSDAITTHMAPVQSSTLSSPFPTRAFVLLGLVLTITYSLPSIFWFIAITLASVSDVTALWNTNAFFAYVFTVTMYKLHWEPRKLMAVLLATLGVLIVVYGGSSFSPLTSTAPKATAPLIGDLLTLLASVIYGLYQVMYEKYVALSATCPKSTLDTQYQSLPIFDANPAEEAVLVDDAIPPPPGLYPNLLTSLMGLFTCLILWMPIPLLHYFDLEPFALPPNAQTYITIAGIACAGVLFNAGFMVLLGIWGPVITSVGNLLTIVLVLLSDALMDGATDTITVWSLVGAGAIIAAFGVLAYDMTNKHQVD